MKILITILLIIATAIPALSDGLVIDTATCSDTWLVESDFEDAADDAQWTTSGAVDLGYSTSGLGMSGDDCARLENGSYIEISFTDQSTVYVMWRHRIEDTQENIETIGRLLESDDTEVGRFAVDIDGDLRVYPIGGTTSSWRAAGLTADNTVWVKFRYTAGTGVNAEMSSAYWNGSSWDTWNTANDGTATGDAGKLRIENNQDSAAEYGYADNVFVSSSDFTEDPTTYCHP